MVCSCARIAYLPDSWQCPDADVQSVRTLPGVNRQGLAITLEGNEITLVGRRTVEPAKGEALFRERGVADFRRVFELDPAIDTAKISASMEQGVLTLTLPKSERVKPRKITVND